MKYSYRWLPPENWTLDKPRYSVSLDDEFEDIQTVRELERPQREELLKVLVAGDEVYVPRMVELGRTLKDLHTTIEKVLNKDASLHFFSEGLRFCKKTNAHCLPELMQLLISIVNFNTSVVLEHRRKGAGDREGLGSFKGPPSRFDAKQIEKIRKEFHETKMTKADLAKKWGISRTYLYRIAQKP